MHNMYRGVERHLYMYQQHKREVEAYEAHCIDRHKAPTNEGVRGSYRSDPTARGGINLVDRPAHIQEAMLWIWAIETAWAELTAYKPEHATLMETYYGLSMPFGRSKDKATATKYSLMNCLNISERTFYAWKDDIVDAVAHAGIQCGVLRPYKEKGPA